MQAPMTSEIQQADNDGHRILGSVEEMGASAPFHPVSEGDYADMNPACRDKIRELATPAQEADLMIKDDKVERAGRYLSDLESEKWRLLPLENESNEPFNEMVRDCQADYEVAKEKAEIEKVTPLAAALEAEKRNRDSVKVRLQTTEGEVRSIEADVAKRSDVEEVRKKEFVAVQPLEGIHTYIEWFARIVLAVVEALSLGLLTEVVNPYRPVCKELIPLAFIGLVITTLSGESVKFLAGESAASGEISRKVLGRIDRKWRWLLIGMAAVTIVVGMSVTLFGVMKVLNSTGALSAKGGETAIPLVVLLACTSTFILPYVAYEVSLGYRLGQLRYQNREAAKRAKELSALDPATEERLLSLRISISSYQTELEVSEQRILDLQAEINRLRDSIAPPVYIPPQPYTGDGLMTTGPLATVGIPFKGATLILPKSRPAVNDQSIIDAKKALKEAVAERDWAYAEVLRDLLEEERRRRSRRAGVFPQMRQWLLGR